MKYDSNNHLIIDRDEDTLRGIFEMFDVLEKMELETAIVFSDEKKRFILTAKDPIDVVKLDFAYSEFYTEFITWLYGFPDGIKKPFWVLDEKKLDLLATCIKTSVKYYLLHKQKLFAFKPQDNLLDVYCKLYEKELEAARYYKN
jgi:hypothetical protein